MTNASLPGTPSAPPDDAHADDRHCQRLPVGERWQGATQPAASFEINGDTLSMTIDVLTQGEHRESAAGSRGEEVAAVLDGEFEIDAAGEFYVLAAGDAILIPPLETRRFTCRSPRGVLYRTAVGIGPEAASGTTRASR